MPKFKMLAFNNPVEGREDEYNHWYTHTHLPDVLKIPGIESAQRFALTKTQKAGTPLPWQYLALYECEADDVRQVLDALRDRLGTPELPISSALAEQRVLWCMEPVSDVIRRQP